MTETNENPYREKIKKASLDSGFEPPEEGSSNEQETYGSLLKIDGYFLDLLEVLEVQLPQDNQDSMVEPIILDADHNDSRLRSDKPISSSLTPQEVIGSLSWPIDEETGMPKIPVPPDLYPWEIVSHL